MSLSLYARLTVSQRMLLDLDLFGGATESIFPEVERFLEADSDHQKALQWIAKNKDSSRYRSVMDFIVCETFPEWRSACFRYYAGSGVLLRDEITMDQRDQYAWKLMEMVYGAYKAFCEERWMSWGHLREQVLKEAA